ncbi:ABC transporter permease subunit [[Brevibacterium] frigoritolerans]|uniref:ABC transporter permease subunit n=1 Tax=Peribacillus frigoritolerans TaxID=450367 RepID=A0A941JBR0_9BACI|nr:ABC transporter permease subunit [Peribacillus frigoritolerans]
MFKAWHYFSTCYRCPPYFLSFRNGFAIASIIKPNSWIDYVARFVGILGTAVPNFWLAMLLIVVFSVNLGWLPATGFTSF